MLSLSVFTSVFQVQPHWPAHGSWLLWSLRPGPCPQTNLKESPASQPEAYQTKPVTGVPASLIRVELSL